MVVNNHCWFEIADKHIPIKEIENLVSPSMCQKQSRINRNVVGLRTRLGGVWSPVRIRGCYKTFINNKKSIGRIISDFFHVN